jgi:glucosamine-6-phosphate deaminase
VDLPVVQELKRYIRESEAIAALESVGISRSVARFLNLPFYRTGEVRKRPIGDEDVAIVGALIEEAHPDLVFVAGDLSDPHGTHRMCKAAVDQALARYAGPRPEVWSYRGAWQEWSLTEADVLVPLSQDELRARCWRSSNTSRRRTRRPSPVATTTASSGSASRRGTSRRRRTPTGWDCRSIARWRPIAWSPPGRGEG